MHAMSLCWWLERRYSGSYRGARREGKAATGGRPYCSRVSADDATTHFAASSRHMYPIT